MKRIIVFLLSMIVTVCTFISIPIKADASAIKVHSSIGAVTAASYKMLKYGSKGTSVKKLQTRLAYLGYYSGNIDGKYGPLTKSAVKNFQKASGINANGTANNATQIKLFSNNAPVNSKGVSYSVKYIDNDYYYDIALNNSEQDYVRKMCKKYNVSFEMVLALMKVESGYKASAKSKTNDYGIMQINKGNHSYLKKKLGVKNFLDFKQNTQAGVYMLSRYTSKHSDVHKVLMCYNLGEGAAAKKWKKGTVQTSYSLKVVAAMEQLKRK